MAKEEIELQDAINFIIDSLYEGLDNCHSDSINIMRKLMTSDAWIGEEREAKNVRKAEQVLLDCVKSFSVLKEELKENDKLQYNLTIDVRKISNKSL